ncbi:MAG: MarR family winged helix-turn-helix transcriptional regulator [Bradymonadia bacterium]
MSDEHEYFSEHLESAKGDNMGHLLIKAARLFNEHSLGRLQASVTPYAGVRMAHLSLMPHLDLEGTRITELARRVGVSKQAVGQLVDDMQRMGLVRRERDPDDGRARRVVFTEKGQAGMLQGLSILDAVGAEVTHVLGEAETGPFLDALRRIIDHFEESP